ncbi:MAG: DUF5622 domain-containing protein [Pyrodictiaceae archaeon]
MGGKHGKYAYVLREDGWYVKVRLLKSRSDDSPDKYVIVGFKTRKAPETYPIIRLEDLPEEDMKTYTDSGPSTYTR